MTITTEPPLQQAELERLTRTVDPAAFFVRPRILRRLIKRHGQAAGFGVFVPHRERYTIDGGALLAAVDRTELGLAPEQQPPPKATLLAKPDPGILAALPRGRALVHVWRQLFHAHVHLALEQRIADGKLTDADLRRRIHRIGTTEFAEIRTVLGQDRELLPPGDDRTVYVEFAATYLELRYFAPAELPVFFPGIADFKEIDAVLAEDVDAAAILAATRLPGAPEPTTDDHAAEAAAPNGQPPAPPTPEASRGLNAAADSAAARGNLVRAAILRARALSGAPPEAAANTELDLLFGRLQRALALSETEVADWRRALAPLLAGAASGFWTLEARLLYDLQKACVDRERGVFALDVFGWAFTLGRRPLKRPLPAQPEVRILQHLRRAAKRVARARLSAADRKRLGAVINLALTHGIERVRAHFGPLIVGALDGVGLQPANLPERIARDKLVEELLDRLVERSLLTLGDVRDAVSRNQLKMPDLAGLGEFLTGDELLRLDRRLATALEGVYRPGEVYLRGLQRISSTAFGTRPGRLLTRFLLLPFGLAFVALKGISLLIEEGMHGLKLLRLLQDESAEAMREAFGDAATADFLRQRFGDAPVFEVAGIPTEHHHFSLATPWSVGALAVFLVFLFNVPAFRHVVGQVFQALGRGLHAVFIDAPVWLLTRPAVQAFLHSAPVVFFHHYLLTPLVLAGLTGAVALIAGATLALAGTLAGAVFVLSVILLNTRFGRDLEEVVVDGLGWLWVRLSVNLLPGLFRLIVDWSRRFLEGVERVLYSVDEWMRFRSGESGFSLAIKAILSPIWFVITYVVRIYVNLLIEPTVNPIKHFPVVTVGHKLMLPFLMVLYHFLLENLSFLGPVLGRGFVVLTIFFLPGIFGFLVWELKENWRLYRANRPETLKPVVIGSHGETMLRLLRPGFHSGTVPKVLAKLRRAERKGNHAAAHKRHEALHHVEEGVRHFVEREFLHLLEQSKSWGGLKVGLRHVGLACNRIRIELTCPELSAEDMVVTFDLRAGWLIAGVIRAGWSQQLSEPQSAALRAALGGLYKLAGVDLTREQIDTALARAPYDVNREGLIVWPTGDFQAETVYPLGDGAPPVLDAERLLFAKVPLTWERWVQVWDSDQQGHGLPPEFLEGVRLLPAAPLAA